MDFLRLEISLNTEFILLALVALKTMLSADNVVTPRFCRKNYRKRTHDLAWT